MYESETDTFLYYLQEHDGVEEEPLGHAIEFRITMLVLIPVSFAVGLAFMCVFYRTQHPNGRMPDKSKEASLF